MRYGTTSVSEYDVGEAVLLINEGRFLGGLQLVKSTIRRDQCDFYALTYRRIPSIRILLESFVSNESMKLRCPAVLIDRVRGYESIVCQNIGRSRKALELGLGAGPHWHGLYLLLCVTSYW